MGKGDKKTKRGKIFKGSKGRLRPRKKPNEVSKPAVVEKPDLKKKPVRAKKEAEKKE